jgi:hypothetical protein
MSMKSREIYFSEGLQCLIPARRACAAGQWRPTSRLSRKLALEVARNGGYGTANGRLC